MPRDYEVVIDSKSVTQPRDYTFSFPHELERYIFELAIMRYNAIHVICVARYVQEWLEPLLYTEIRLPSWKDVAAKLFLRTLEARPSAFFALHVKTLLLSDITNLVETRKILEKCTGLQNLVHWHVNWDKLLNSCSFDGHHLTHLTTSGLTTDTSSLRSGFFKHITHLGLHAAQNIASSLATLHYLPCLTHLACSVTPYAIAPTNWKLAVDTTLKECRMLKFFWLVCSGYEDDFAWQLSAIIHDLRFVVHAGHGQFHGFGRGDIEVWHIPQRIVAHQHKINMRV